MGIAKAAPALRASAVLLLSSCAACTRLGPMPAMTGVPVVPAGRTTLELQAAMMPGYYLSSTVTPEPESGVLPQLLGLLEPSGLIHVPGLFAGARYAGDASSGAALEPLLGYRLLLDEDERFALGGTGFLSYASEAQGGAQFSALRGGVEAGVDARMTGSSSYAELHTHLGFTLTGLDADGTYCVDSEGFGLDCSSQSAPQMKAAGGVKGIFPTAHVGASLDFARHIKIAFHGVRLAADLAGGTLPTVVSGQERGVKLFGTGGLSLTVGIGQGK